MAGRRLPLLLALMLPLSLLSLAPASAQTTGSLRGAVLDKDGQPVVGAKVLIVNEALGVAQAAITDAKGEYRLQALPPGKGFSITVSFPGLGTISQPDVEVATGRATGVSIVLRPDREMIETVTSVATVDVIDQDDAGIKMNINAEVLDALPLFGRDFTDALVLAPGVTDTDGDGNPTIHGARETDVNTIVDGVSTVNPLTGERGQELNANSIQEIEILTTGASPEFDRAQGGFVRVTTKSGGNDFEGAFRIDWSGDLLDGDGAGIDNSQLHGGLIENGLRDLSFNDIFPALTVSGPIVKDRAWYFVTAEYRQIEQPVNALSQAFVRGHYETRLFGKVSWDLTASQKLVFTATFDPQEDDNQGLTSFTAVESGFTTHSGGRNLVLRDTAVFSPSLFLETTLQDFVTRDDRDPTLDADTNGNGLLFDDRNHNGFIDATERDAGEDHDENGAFNVYEDFLHPNGRLDPGEDLDRDGSLTVPHGCEGDRREDRDCDHFLDNINEDDNGNGLLDGTEDRDGDGRLDLGDEDRNGNSHIDDRPFPAENNHLIPDENGRFGNYYPYHEATPLGRDRDLENDQRTRRISGPFNVTWTGDSGRQTLRQDLTLFFPEWHGQHEMKTGYAVERERYARITEQRPSVLPNAAPPAGVGFVPSVGVILPAENSVANEARSLTGAIYITDTYKPLPNLSLNVGVRFTRETTDSLGYTQFDPVAERALYDRLNALTGQEFLSNLPDTTSGNNDGLVNYGICGDPLLYGDGDCKQNSNAIGSGIIEDLRRPKVSRLTQHHTATTIVASDLEALFPGAIKVIDGETIIDREKLRALGAVFQEEEAFRLTNNNLAPRLAVSWDPWSDSKTKVFASWGRFYDKLFLSAVIPEEGPDTVTRYYLKDDDGVTDAGVANNGFGDAVSKAPPTASQVDRGLQTPFTDEWSIGFERELAPEVSIRLSYIHREARLGLQDRDINHTLRYDPATGRPLDQYGRLLATGGRGSALQPAGDVLPDLFIQNFFFNQVLRLGNNNTSRFSGVEMQITKRLSRKWQMDASYTYSRAQGDAEDFNSLLGNDPATGEYEYGYLDFDQRHIVRFNGTAFLAGDWTLGGVLQWASGLPYAAITSRLSLDNFSYPQFRTLFGGAVQTTNGAVFVPENRNSRRNDAVLNIDVQASKAFVIGRSSSRLFLAVQNLLNTDDLEIDSYEPSNPNRGGALQLQAQRRFGRRFQVGFQFDF